MSAFMVPIAEYFDADEAAEYVPWVDGALDDDDTPEAGWYSRLSAPGYMDCTEWAGPFPNAFRALRDCCRTFDVNIHGEPI